MKRLRPTIEEKTELLAAITQRLNLYKKGSIEAFSIDDLKASYKTIPKDVKKPILKIEAGTYMRMLELINQSSVECSWHGLVHRDLEANTYYVYDILVFPQINSSTSTTTDEKAFAAWQTNLILDPNFPIENLRLHGHSHVNMNVFSSGIDDKYQEDLLTKVDNGDYYIFLIMNKKMEICIFIYDFVQQVLFEKNDIDFQIISYDTDVREWAKEELKKNATTAAPVKYKQKYSWDDYDDQMTIFGSNNIPIFKGGKTYGSK